MSASGTPRRAGEFALPQGARHAYCRSCGHDIAWIRTAQGRAMPLDLATVVERGGERYALNHFATCPQGRDWSGHGARSAATPVAADPAPPTSGATYVASRRERYRLAGGALPAAWWLIGRRDFRDAAAPSDREIAAELAALAADTQED